KGADFASGSCFVTRKKVLSDGLPTSPFPHAETEPVASSLVRRVPRGPRRRLGSCSGRRMHEGVSLPGGGPEPYADSRWPSSVVHRIPSALAACLASALPARRRAHPLPRRDGLRLAALY